MSQGNRLNHPNMNQQFFSLPSEIVIDILSRLPVRSIISCKCVQKSWLRLVETGEFVKFHLSKSVAGLIVQECNNQSKLYKLFEFEDEFNLENHDHHYKLVTKFSTNLGCIKGSVDGLILLCKREPKTDALYICNPLTREYINLHYPQVFQESNGRVVTWGFGLSKMTSQYKVVGISQGYKFHQETREWQTFEAGCHVYTLGTGLWRSCALPEYGVIPNSGLFTNGNLHWLACAGCQRVSCFDLETEHFRTLSLPALHLIEKRWIHALDLFAWGDCLGLCWDSGDEIRIWLMKEYGVEESWTKEIVISKSQLFGYKLSASSFPIRVFRDSDILILWYASCFIYYSTKHKTTRKVDSFNLPRPCYIGTSFLHTPSFLSLKSFGRDVSSF